MEVAALFMSSKELLELFDTFIYQYPKLSLYHKDNDTAYFRSKKKHYAKIYYQYELRDPEKEFSYNYTPEESAKVNELFQGKNILMFYISFDSSSLLHSLIIDFKQYVLSSNKSSLWYVVFSDPFKGVRLLD